MVQKTCRHCRNQIDLSVEICPYCHKKQSLNWIKLIFWVCIFIAVIAFANHEGGKTENSETINLQNTTQAANNSKSTTKETTTEVTIKYIELTSTELIDSYNENSVKCKQLYDKKNLKVTGIVSDVGEDIFGSVYVCLEHDTEYTFIGIQCYAKDKQTENKIAELKKGDEITVQGIGDCGSLTFSLIKATIK